MRSQIQMLVLSASIQHMLRERQRLGYGKNKETSSADRETGRNVYPGEPESTEGSLSALREASALCRRRARSRVRDVTAARDGCSRTRAGSSGTRVGRRPRIAGFPAALSRRQPAILNTRRQRARATPPLTGRQLLRTTPTARPSPPPFPASTCPALPSAAKVLSRRSPSPRACRE